MITQNLHLFSFRSHSLGVELTISLTKRCVQGPEGRTTRRTGASFRPATNWEMLRGVYSAPSSFRTSLTQTQGQWHRSSIFSVSRIPSGTFSSHRSFLCRDHDSNNRKAQAVDFPVFLGTAAFFDSSICCLDASGKRTRSGSFGFFSFKESRFFFGLGARFSLLHLDAIFPTRMFAS